MPVLNPKTILNNRVRQFQLMDKHNDMRAMVRQLKFSSEQPSFYLLNVGETHYPYALPENRPTNGRGSAVSTVCSSTSTTRWSEGS